MNLTDAAPDAGLLEALTNPASVALIGASDSPSKLQSRPMRFMQQHGFAGRVFPVNPGRQTVLGQTAYPDIGAVPAPVDHAYILLETNAAIDALRDCARAGVKVVSVLADGFAEAGGDGAKRQQQLVEIARASNILLIGPNSTGLVDTRFGFSCTTNAAFAAQQVSPGKLAVISQSGSLIGTVFSRGAARGLTFSTLISVGNEATCGVGEIGNILVDDAQTNGFILFMETIRNPAQVARFARRAAQLNKPLVCYMIGRSDEGRALSVSHTGAMTGSAQAVSSFLKCHGIREVDNFESLLEAPGALSGARHTDSDRPKSVTVVSTTGGGGAMVIDRLGERNVTIAPCSPAARQTLQAQDIPLGTGKLVDVTLAGARYESMKAVVSTLITDPATGVLLVVIGSSAQFQPELAVKPILDAVEYACASAAPVLAFPLPQADESLRLFAQAGITAFRTVESCAETVAMLMHDGQPEPLADLANGGGRSVALALAAQDIARLRSAAHRTMMLDEVQAGLVFATLGIAGPPQCVVPANEAIPAGIGLSFPVVAKLVSPDLPHKSDAGAIMLELPHDSALQAAVEQMKRNVAASAPAAQLVSVLVQTMQSGVAELLLGLTHDPLVGPMVTVGIGGTAAEVYLDTSVRPAPVTPAVARKMIGELRGVPLLTGFRGREPADLDAAAQAVAAFSTLASLSEVAEAEINPLLVHKVGGGVVMLDALIRLADAAPPGNG